MNFEFFVSHIPGVDNFFIDVMNQFTDGEGTQFSQADNEIPQVTITNRVSDVFEYFGDGEISTTKMKSVN